MSLPFSNNHEQKWSKPSNQKQIDWQIEKKHLFPEYTLKTHISTNTHKLKVKGLKQTDTFCQWKRKKKTSKPSYCNRNKADFKTKTVKRYKEGHYLKVKGSIQPKEVTLVNICAPNVRTPAYLKQLLMNPKGHTDSDIIGDINTLFS